jgi:hypothetical protein
MLRTRVVKDICAHTEARGLLEGVYGAFKDCLLYTVKIQVA